MKRTLRLGYRTVVGRLRRPSRQDNANRLIGMAVSRVEPARLSNLGYDLSTIDWAERLLRDGDPTAPFPPADPVESQSDAIRLRGILAYLSQLSGLVEPTIIDARLDLLLRTAVRAIADNPGIGWDTTNAALRLMSLLEGTECLVRAGRHATATALISERFLQAHRRALLAGAFIEPRGNHEAVNALGFAALDMLLRPWSELSERRMRHLERVLTGQILSDGGHVERCPYYHLQVLSALNTIFAANARRAGTPIPTLADLHSRLRSALRAMVIPSAAVPARFGDISRLWSGRRVEVDVKRALGTSAFSDATATAFLPDFGVIRTGWWIHERRVELVANVGPFGLAGNAGHAHDDCLSYCLYVDGVEIIADPGVFRYANDPTSVWFKHACAHNSVRWPNSPGPVARQFFRWKLEPLRESVTVSRVPGTASIRAQRRVYFQRVGSISHVRTWSPIANGLVVGDRILADCHDPCIARLNVGPRCRLEMDASHHQAVVLDGHVPCLSVRWQAPSGVVVTRSPSRYAAQYGDITLTEALEWSLPRGSHGWSIDVRFELL